MTTNLTIDLSEENYDEIELILISILFSGMNTCEDPIKSIASKYSLNYKSNYYKSELFNYVIRNKEIMIDSVLLLSKLLEKYNAHLFNVTTIIRKMQSEPPLIMFRRSLFIDKSTRSYTYFPPQEFTDQPARTTTFVVDDKSRIVSFNMLVYNSLIIQIKFDHVKHDVYYSEYSSLDQSTKYVEYTTTFE